MMKSKIALTGEVAHAIIYVSYESMPDVDELKATIEQLNGDGRVTEANLFINREVKIDLL